MLVLAKSDALEGSKLKYLSKIPFFIKIFCVLIRWKTSWNFSKLVHSYHRHCGKWVRIRNYSGPYFPAFGLNTDQNNPNADTFYSVRSNIMLTASIKTPNIKKGKVIHPFLREPGNLSLVCIPVKCRKSWNVTKYSA